MPAYSPKNFAAALRRARAVSGLSQEQLGHLSGYHRTYISQLERGAKNPSLKTLFDLCGALNIQPSSLVSDIETCDLDAGASR